MVPHALFVSSDRHVDRALSLLTWVVSGALLATAVWILFMWFGPLQQVADRGDVGPPDWAAMSEAFLNPTRIEFDLPRVYVPVIYRCEHNGRVTYSDRPCMVGRVRALPVRLF
jgi:hypothetical protein